MWTSGWRQPIWEKIQKPWDLIIIGGGITGAGILREAVRSGLKTLLVEAGDFSSGTSSQSSKLVHGGFRYLRNGQIDLVLQSVRGRERLMSEGKGLVYPLDFLMTCYKGDKIPAPLLGLGLALYDIMALKWDHRFLGKDNLIHKCPHLNKQNLIGGFRYTDALTDDSRLVLRLIRESVRKGGTALNYTRVEDLLFSSKGSVCGVAINNLAPDGIGQTAEVQAPVVINATGAWADTMRSRVGKDPVLRKLRGSHLVIPDQKLPLKFAVSIFHPRDSRPVFAIPWEGVIIIGTTDVDHKSQNLSKLTINQEETDYLMEAINYTFVDLGLCNEDIQCTFSGVRGVLDTGKKQSWKEPRKHLLWIDKGLVTITGGKLTTFRKMAQDTLNSVKHTLTYNHRLVSRQPVLNNILMENLNFDLVGDKTLVRLTGRYGYDAIDLIGNAKKDELENIGGSPVLWAELRWSAQHEGIVHLDDLLLRRVRLGILLPEGGVTLLDRIRDIVQT
jgi:glycerol-3-phosphate dehydrogenase